ncbi:MAG: substrate-binding domain-containing protein [Verrucomicrobiales bacterium]|nr:substrate-binding domain-containing protein [Verrucomicrobiales bacterium]
MREIQIKTAVEQTSDALKVAINAGELKGTMPGASRIAKTLGVNHKTVESALRNLELEGLIINKGARQGRLVNSDNRKSTKSGIRIAIFLLDQSDMADKMMIEIMYRLEESGHYPFYAHKSMLDLRMNKRSIARIVNNTEADAWITLAAPKEILDWFSKQEMPTFAIFGNRLEHVNIAGASPGKSHPVVNATQNLIELGHRRIILVIRKHQRYPMTKSAQAFLDALRLNGIQTSDFNLPDWEETAEGFNELLESIFKITPPTAIITDEPYQYIAAQNFMANNGIQVPKHVSLICSDHDPIFRWCLPPVSHIVWDHKPILRRIDRWATNIKNRKFDVRQTILNATFVKGGTIGPPSKIRVRI